MSPRLSSWSDQLTAGGEVGPYRLVRSLGSGGMARVFLAEHRHLGHLRAVKVLPPEHSDARVALTMRLMTEARAMARLRHPSIVEVFECDTLPSAGAFIAMEYLRGDPAGDWLQKVGPLERHPRLAAAMVGGIAEALAYAHRQGVIHRDVKPDNLFVVPDPVERGRFSLKILDFGIAKIVREKPLVTTQIGFVVGTPFYMAPEGWESGASVDHRTDIYSLGCVFFELLCGRRPFLGDDALQIMRAHLVDPPPDIRALAPGVPQELADLVARMLNKVPQDRPATMETVVASLEAFLGIDRSRFGDLLELPDDSPGRSGLRMPMDPTLRGLGLAMKPVVTNTTEMTSLSVRPHFRSWRSMITAALIVVVGGAVLMGRSTAANRAHPTPRQFAATLERDGQPATKRPRPPDPPFPFAPAPPLAVTEPATTPQQAGIRRLAETNSGLRPPPRARTFAVPVRQPRNHYRPVGD